MIPQGRSVEGITVVVSKRRFARIGMVLTGHPHSTVIESRDPRFRVGDHIYVVNGRYTRSTYKTSWRIWRKANVSITLLRDVPQPDTHGVIYQQDEGTDSL